MKGKITLGNATKSAPAASKPAKDGTPPTFMKMSDVKSAIAALPNKKAGKPKAESGFRVNPVDKDADTVDKLVLAIHESLKTKSLQRVYEQFKTAGFYTLNQNRFREEYRARAKAMNPPLKVQERKRGEGSGLTTTASKPAA